MTRHAQMRKDFIVAAQHYRLTPEATKMAWGSARGNPASAAACYAAIVNSLKREDGWQSNTKQ